MAETHELRLKINAAAARAGAREFVAAINSIKTAIRQLDRDSSGVFVRLNKAIRDAKAAGARGKINIIDRTALRNLQSYTDLAQKAVKATGNTSRSAANLAARMQQLASSYATARSGADTLTSSVTRLNAQLARQSSQTIRAPQAASGATAASGGSVAGASSRGADQVVADQTKVQRALEQSRLSVERLTTQLMRVGGFQTINELGRTFRDFQRQVADGTRTSADFSRAQNMMRSAITGASTSLVTLSARARDQARAEREAANATRDRERALMQASGALRAAEQETARLTNRLRAAGDTSGLERLNRAMVTLRTQMSGTVGSTAAVSAAVNNFKNATSALNVGLIAVESRQAGAARSAREMAKAESAAAAEARKLERDMRSAAGAASAADRAFRKASGGMRGMENAFSGSFQAASLFRTALGSITLGTFTQSVFRAGDALQQFQITMEVASGSAEAAAEDLAFVNDMSARLGTSLSASRDAFAKFAVSSSIAGVSADTTKDIFESVSTAMAVLGKGTEDQRLAFLALEQMMSKGVISAEELRRQLGERLPGAVNLMAKAVGVSTSELQDMLKAGELISSEVLPKFAQELNRTFGSQLDRTFNRAGSNLGRMQNEFQKILEVIAGGGFLDELSRQFRDITSLLRTSDVREAAERIGRGLADAAEIAGNAIQFLITNIEEIGNIVKNVIGAIVIAQFARMGQAILLSGQQLIVATNAFRGLGAASTVASTQVATVGAQAATSAGKVTGLTAALGGAAAAGGRFGAVLGVLGRGLGLLGGPIGIAFAALSVVPLIFNSIERDTSTVSAEYERAMSRMGAANFSFIDTARAVEEATKFEQLQANLIALKEARDILDAFSLDDQVASDIERTLSSLTAEVNVSATRDEIRGLAEDIEIFRKTADAEIRADMIESIKNRISEIRSEVRDTGDSFDLLRKLEDILLPAAQAAMVAKGALEENKEIAGSLAEKINEATAEYQALQIQLEALAGANVPIEQLSASTQTLLSEFEGGFAGFLEQLAALGQMSGGFGSGLGLISIEFQKIRDEFDGSAESAQAVSEKLAALRPQLERLADETNNYGRTTQQTAQRMLEMVDRGDELNGEIQNVDASASAAAGAIDSLKASVNGSTSAMASGTSMAFQYAGALQAVAAAQVNVANMGAEAEQRRSRELEVAELRVVDPRQAAIKQDQFFGSTGRILADMNKELSAAQSQLDSIATSNGPDRAIAMAVAQKQVAEIEGRIASERERGAEAAGRLFDLRSQSKKGGGGGGSKKEELTALQELNKAGEEYVQQLEAQNHANQLLASGMTSSTEAAKMLGEAFAEGVILTDEQTASFIAQVTAAERLNDALSQLANDPVNDWMNNVSSWREAGQAIETQVFESLGDEISKFIQTGKFSFDELGASILSTAADIISDMAVKELTSLFGGNISGTGEGGFGLGGIFSNLFGNNSVGQPEGDPLAAGFDGVAAGQQISSAMMQGGQQAAQAIQTAMTTASGQLQAGIAGGGAGAGAQINAQVTTAGTTAGTAMQTSIQSGGAMAATQIGTAVQTGSNVGSSLLGQGVVEGSNQGGGIFSQIFGSMFSGGGGGGGGGLFGSLFSFIPALFGSGGGVTTGSGPAIPQVMAPSGMFKNAPHFAMGTPNVSGGVPAVLHDNEAVVPLTGGRKIPVDMGGTAAGGSGVVVNQNINVSTPNADSFRKSQKQIAAESAAAAKRAQKANG